jgi:hypothetical protein
VSAEAASIGAGFEPGRQGTIVHTAFEISESMFRVTVRGESMPRDELLDWRDDDRLGVVVRRPLGMLEAGLLTLLCVTAFYDAPGRKRRSRPLYPSIYLFHVGGRWGFSGEFDFWPERKEVFVPGDADALLQALNDRAITHLALPDGPPADPSYRYKEPEELIDRTRQCYVYAIDGPAVDDDIVIRTTSPEVLRNFAHTIDLPTTLALREGNLAAEGTVRAGTAAGIDSRRYVALMRELMREVDPSDPAAAGTLARVRRGLEEGGLAERLRRVDAKAALRLLA